jgi:hypothetical protein
MRSGVIAKGGSLLTKRPLAMRERSLSGSGWKVRVMGTIASYLDVLQLPPGDAEHICFYSQASIQVSCTDVYTIRVQPAGNGS